MNAYVRRRFFWTKIFGTRSNVPNQFDTVSRAKTAAHSIFPTPPKSPQQLIRDTNLIRSDKFTHFNAHPSSIEIQKYLDAENGYFDTVCLKWSGLQKQISSELSQWMAVATQENGQNDENSSQFPPPEIGNGYAYFVRDGVYYRQLLEGSDLTEIVFDSERARLLLDTNTMPENVYVTGASISNSHNYLGYVEKQIGEEHGTLKIIDLTRQDSSGNIEIVEGVVNFVWSGDDDAIIYTRLNRQLRPHKVMVRHLGRSNDDCILYHEKDERFFVDVSTTKDKKLIAITSSSRSSSEVRIFDSFHNFVPTGSLPELRVVCERKPQIEYYIDHHQDQLFMVSNIFDNGGDFELATAPTSALPVNGQFVPEIWNRILRRENGLEHFKLDDVDIFSNHFVLYGKMNGLSCVLVHEIASGKTRALELPEKISTLIPGVNSSYQADSFKFMTISAGLRETLFEYNFNTRGYQILRNVPLPNFDRNQYVVRRVNVDLTKSPLQTFNDGLPNILPITLFHHKSVSVKALEGFDFTLSHHSDNIAHNTSSQCPPILLTTYNSYGIDSTLPFDPVYMPLVERGWVIASCHGSGGSEFGNGWYKRGIGTAGKLRAMNELLYLGNLLNTSGENYVALYSLSAGGCVAAAAMLKGINIEIDRFKSAFSAAVLHVPFLDPIAAMSDSDAGLTSTELEEWGNPADDDNLKLLKEYSPMEIIHDIQMNQRNPSPGDATKFPSIYLTSGLKDQRVPFWHALKFTAKLRHHLNTVYGDSSSNSNEKQPLLLQKCRLESGHFGDTSDSTIDNSANWISFLIYDYERRNSIKK